ncbi:MAG: hypothetical protein GEV11_14485 [Streptosporangiales bacterium]|nr:hypothetical protein [Streptosporangiales bacterium]
MSPISRAVRAFRGARGVRAVIAACLLAAVAGCVPFLGDEEQERDPWSSAGVDEPRIDSRSTGGRTVVTVRAETTLPLEDRDNQEGFAERAAKIAWRSHLGRMDTLEITAGQQGHPERARTRTWPRAELGKAFGPRLAGLDAGDEAALRQQLPAADGAYSGRKADRVGRGDAILRELLRTTARERLGAEPRLPETEPEECYGGLSGADPTGEFRTDAEAEMPRPRGAHPLASLLATADQWSRLGLDVDRSGLFLGNEDTIRAELPGVGRAALEDLPARGDRKAALQLSYATDCLKP